MANLIRLPRISAQDYEAIRQILKSNVAGTYDSWLDLRAKWLVEYANDRVIEIDVDPHEFADYLRRTGRAHDLHALLGFVAEKDAK